MDDGRPGEGQPQQFMIAKADKMLLHLHHKGERQREVEKKADFRPIHFPDRLCDFHLLAYFLQSLIRRTSR